MHPLSGPSEGAPQASPQSVSRVADGVHGAAGADDDDVAYVVADVTSAAVSAVACAVTCATAVVTSASAVSSAVVVTSFSVAASLLQRAFLLFSCLALLYS